MSQIQLEQKIACSISELVLDCSDPDALARFWAAALGYDVIEDESELASIEDPSGAGPGMCFVRVPDGKIAKNRMHVDLTTGDHDLDSEVDRLVGLGATRVDIGQGEGRSWVVLADPEGNEFCVV